MKIISYILIVILALLLNNCEKSEPPGPDSCPSRFTKSYIDGFITVDTILIRERTVIIDEDKKTIRFSGIADDLAMLSIENEITLNIYGMYAAICGLYHKNGNINPLNFNEKYQACINKIGDTCYNREKNCNELIITAIYDTLQYIKISCSINFDLEHPAGSSLNDLFTIYLENPYFIVKNNYQPCMEENTYRLSGNSNILHAFTKTKLNEVNFSENPFIGSAWYCVLNKAPQYTGDYSFNIEVKKTNGGILTATSKSLKIKGSE